MTITEVALLLTAITGFLGLFGAAILAVVKGVIWFIDREKAYAVLDDNQKQYEAAAEQANSTIAAITKDRDEWKAQYHDLWRLVEGMTQ